MEREVQMIELLLCYQRKVKKKNKKKKKKKKKKSQQWRRGIFLNFLKCRR